MSEQDRTILNADDTEGHFIRGQEDEDNDTEGHIRVRGQDDEQDEDEDTQGHQRMRGEDDEDDTEGHQRMR